MWTIKAGVVAAAVLALICVAVAVAGPAVVDTVTDGGSSPDETLSPEKAAFLKEEEQRRSYAGPGDETPPQMTPVQSCPVEASSVTTFIKPYANDGPFPPKSATYLTNEGQFFSAPGRPTQVWAGALARDPDQGVLFVHDIQLDPCAATLGSVPVNELRGYLPPGKLGPLTITEIKGNVISFTTDSGSTGSFDLDRQEFTIEGVQETPLPTPPPPAADTPPAAAPTDAAQG